MESLKDNFEQQATSIFGDIHFIYDGAGIVADGNTSFPPGKTYQPPPVPSLPQGNVSNTLVSAVFSRAAPDAGRESPSITDARERAAIPLMEEQSFDTFLVNRKNEMVLEVARQAVNGDDVPCTPFVLYGKSCTGKSHLLNAMANAVKMRGKSFLFSNVSLYNPLLMPVNEVGRIRQDAVFIDDAQRLEDYPQKQDVLASLIDHFRAAGKLLVISLDTHPSHCSGFSHKLLSRLYSGLVLELKKPDLDIRTQYVEQQNRSQALELGKDKIFSIAQRFTDIRLIDGFLTQLAFYRSMQQKRSREEQGALFPDAAEMLEREEQQKLLTHTYIIGTVARHFALSPDDITGKSRDKKVILARHIAIMLCRELLGLSLPKVGRLFSNRDHSSVLYSIKRIKQLQESDKHMHSEVEKMRKMCLHGE